jgi:hypothetical protein
LILPLLGVCKTTPVTIRRSHKTDSTQVMLEEFLIDSQASAIGDIAARAAQ